MRISYRATCRSVLALTTLPLLSWASPASAQEAASADAAAPAESAGVSDIVVTAQRRQQSLQDVPLAVSAFSGASLAEKQINTTLDLTRLVPNLIGTNNVGIGSANTYFLRALGNTESIATFDPPVGTYIDDIYVSRQNANNFSFFDVDRIEVLRGPQGTLFGRNTTGGAINVILKKPSDHVTGFFDGSYGRYDSWTIRGSVDLPVSAKILTKFSAFTDNTNGYVYDTTTGERPNRRRSYGVRGAVRFLPTDTITWDVSTDYIRDNSPNVASTEIDDHYFAHTGLRRDTAPLKGVVVGSKQNYGLQNVNHSFNITSNLQFELGDATLSLITGYRDLGQDYLTDVFDGAYPTGGFSLANRGRFRQFSQEAKLNGKLFDGAIDYVAGVFYLHESNKTDFADIFTLPLGPTGFPLVLTDRTLRNHTSAPAVYAQADWHATGRLTVTIGGRYTSERKSFTVNPNGNPLALGNYNTADVTALGVPRKQTTKLFTPRLAAEYRFSPTFMTYVSATRGFRSGGWNARATNASQFLAFGPEKVWSYEAGLRSDLFDRKMRFNLTGFLADTKKFQLPQAFIDQTGALNFITQNGADLRTYGLEAETTIVPTKGLSLFGNLGLIKARYRNPSAVVVAQQAACRAGNALSCGQGIVDPQGDLAPPQRAPRVTVSTGFAYDAPIGTFLLTPSANASYEARKTVGTAGTANDYVPKQWIIGASLALKPADGPWRVAVECSNCFNNATVGSFFPPAFFFYNQPMIWRVRGSIAF